MSDTYATQEESASVMRPATPNETWLHQQLDRIDPDRHEMGSAGDTPALVKLALELRDKLQAMEAVKDGAYLERNRLVSLLSKIYPAGKKKTAIEGWSEDWHGCVFIDLPSGQASWHFHDSQAHLFEHLPPYTKPWDGHTSEQKYERVTNGAIPHQPDTELANLYKHLRRHLLVVDLNGGEPNQADYQRFDNAVRETMK